MLKITSTLWIDEAELDLEFIQSSGPGGQNVNKVATAVQLRFDVANSGSLPQHVGARLIRLAGKRTTTDGVLILNGRRYRSQERNRQDVIDRLISLVRQAAVAPKVRRRTSPTFASQQRRLDQKRRRSATKRLRRSISTSDHEAGG